LKRVFLEVVSGKPFSFFWGVYPFFILFCFK